MPVGIAPLLAGRVDSFKYACTHGKTEDSWRRNQELSGLEASPRSTTAFNWIGVGDMKRSACVAPLVTISKHAGEQAPLRYVQGCGRFGYLRSWPAAKLWLVANWDPFVT